MCDVRSSKKGQPMNTVDKEDSTTLRTHKAEILDGVTLQPYLAVLHLTYRAQAYQKRK
jgi:hypothetical protein